MKQLKEWQKVSAVVGLVCTSLLCSAFIFPFWSPKVSFPFFALLFGFFLLAHVLRLYRLFILSKSFSPGWKNICLAHFSAGTLGLFPFKINDIARLFFLHFVTGSTLRSAAVLFVERLLDLFSLLLLVLVLSLIFKIELGSLALFAQLLIFFLFLGLSLFFTAYAFVLWVSKRALQNPQSFCARQLVSKIQILRRGIHIIKALLQKNTAALIMSSLGIWAIELAIFTQFLGLPTQNPSISGISTIFKIVLNHSHSATPTAGSLLAWYLTLSGLFSAALALFMFFKKHRIGIAYTPSLKDNIVIIYDESQEVPDHVRALSGVNKYCDICCKYGELKKYFAHEASLLEVQTELLLKENTKNIVYEIMQRPENSVFLCISSQVLFQSQQALERLALLGLYVEGNYSDPKHRIVILKDRASALRFFSTPQGIPGLQESICFDAYAKDIATPEVIGELLSENTPTRHFNCLNASKNEFTKSSLDAKKLKKEHDFYWLLPSDMQHWFVKPYDFRIKDGRGSYTMKRIHLPNVASLWVEGAFDKNQFEILIRRLFCFLESRTKHKKNIEELQTIRKNLYLDKVHSRFAQLRSWGKYQQLHNLYAGMTGGENLEELYSRYTLLFSSISEQTEMKEAVIGHGDLCFSNILYSRDTQEIHLVDPRGACTEAELFTDPYYDVCKLSHSILGAYDFINMHKCEIVANGDLHARLEHKSVPSWARQLFEQAAQEAGFDFRFVRLGELSLFLSMLPLHIDHPKKVLSFLLVARNIFNEIESSTHATRN